ncbi:hypothetical protein Slin14017_G026710 [Septoria linicola]|nr:hypothetical protein Slin14017_G026710 [Septoria linicola]
MANTRAEVLSPIPELLLEYKDPKACEECEIRRRETASTEDEGYGSESQRPGIDMMLDNLAEMSRRLSLAPSELLGIDEALHASMQSNENLNQMSKFEQPDIAGSLDMFWRTVRQESAALRESRDEARADSVLLLEEISKKAGEIEERDAKIKKLKTELSLERKAGKQLQEAMEDLLAWVDSNRPAEPKMSRASQSPVRERETHRLLEHIGDIPTYGVAFRSGFSNKVTVWKVQVVESYESKTGMPIFGAVIASRILLA